jgi:hypothetical protein
MKWEFSFVWFFVGILVIAAGVLIVRFHQKIADNLAGGVQNYDKTKLAGLIACGLGFLFMTNLHSLILYFIFHLIMPTQFP